MDSKSMICAHFLSFRVSKISFIKRKARFESKYLNAASPSCQSVAADVSYSIPLNRFAYM